MQRSSTLPTMAQQQQQQQQAMAMPQLPTNALPSEMMPAEMQPPPQYAASAAYANLMSNIGGGNGGGGGGGGMGANMYGSPYNKMGMAAAASVMMSGGKRQPVPIVEALAQEKAENREIMMSLNRDFETLAGMTLTDDDDNLDTLFLRQPSLTRQTYVFNLLLNLYKLKYSDLLARYPSVQVWLSFCLVTLVYGSESRLRSRCSGASLSYVPVMGSSHEALGLVSRKRKRFGVGGGGGETSKRSNVSGKPPHPFLETAYYLEHPMLFKIGAMIRHCVPSEFAVRFVNVKPGPVSKIITKNEKSVLQGLRGTFTRPVVALMAIRRVQNYPFVTVPFMDNVGQLVGAMSQMAPEADIFSMGIRQNMMVEDLVENSVSSYSDEKGAEDSSVMMIALLTSFQCVGTSAGTVDIRSYTNSAYKLNNARVTIADNEMTRFETLNQDREEQYMQQLDAYDAKLVELGFKSPEAEDDDAVGDDHDDGGRREERSETSALTTTASSELDGAQSSSSSS